MATEVRQPPVAPFALPSRKHLGKIQGVAQALTVIASALGPLLLAETVSRTGSHASIFYLLTVVVMVLAVLAWLVKLPVKRVVVEKL